MKNLYQNMYRQMTGGRPFALATILASRGSTPRTPGTRMMVWADSSIHGTVGGGSVEARVIAACADMLEASPDGGSRMETFFLDAGLQAGLDMVCGGELTVWTEVFNPGADDSRMAVFRSLADLEKKNRAGLLVTRLEKTGENCFVTGKALVPAEGAPVGQDIIPETLMARILAGEVSGTAVETVQTDGNTFILEPFAPGPILFIFGAGHVGLKLAQMAAVVDLPHVVVDDRPEFANAARFPDARSVHALEEYALDMGALGVDDRAVVVIMTRGHLYDEIVLEQALSTRAPYIGMIGSSRKRETIYRRLMERGVPEKQLDAVFSPIGLDIRSETPAEIAVSVIAQVIHVMNKKRLA